MKLAIGCDHVGIQMKKAIIEHLQAQGHEMVDVGTYTSESCDYPLYGYKVAKLVQEKQVDYGILICGTGVGISLAANKVKGIRAVVCSESYSAALAKMHNNANIVAMGARVIGEATALQIVDAFLNAQFEGGRHQRRVDKVMALEQE